MGHKKIYQEFLQNPWDTWLWHRLLLQVSIIRADTQSIQQKWYDECNQRRQGRAEQAYKVRKEGHDLGHEPRSTHDQNHLSQHQGPRAEVRTVSNASQTPNSQLMRQTVHHQVQHSACNRAAMQYQESQVSPFAMILLFSNSSSRPLESTTLLITSQGSNALHRCKSHKVKCHCSISKDVSKCTEGT